jgi:nucleoid-associated protein YgaU
MHQGIGMTSSALFRYIKRAATEAPAWANVIRYRTTPGDRFDLMGVSRRIYGTPDEWMVIQAAAGLDSPELPLPEMDLILPTPAQLAAMKAAAGYPT